MSVAVSVCTKVSLGFFRPQCTPSSCSGPPCFANFSSSATNFRHSAWVCGQLLFPRLLALGRGHGGTNIAWLLNLLLAQRVELVELLLLKVSLGQKLYVAIPPPFSDAVLHNQSRTLLARSFAPPDTCASARQL